ncbi:hypothetical protein BDV93DRAFT_563383 [Ceratobasidium sp. AG-I]|nr:hypothetical protein BDV93DRAFT_563383 [Ceratobasidium sp. AG-I]
MAILDPHELSVLPSFFDAEYCQPVDAQKRRVHDNNCPTSSRATLKHATPAINVLVLSASTADALLYSESPLISTVGGTSLVSRSPRPVDSLLRRVSFIGNIIKSVEVVDHFCLSYKQTVPNNTSNLGHEACPAATSTSSRGRQCYLVEALDASAFFRRCSKDVVLTSLNVDLPLANIVHARVSLRAGVGIFSRQRQYRKPLVGLVTLCAQIRLASRPPSMTAFPPVSPHLDLVRRQLRLEIRSESEEATTVGPPNLQRLNPFAKPGTASPLLLTLSPRPALAEPLLPQYTPRSSPFLIPPPKCPKPVLSRSSNIQKLIHEFESSIPRSSQLLASVTLVSDDERRASDFSPIDAGRVRSKNTPRPLSETIRLVDRTLDVGSKPD